MYSLAHAPRRGARTCAQQPRQAHAHARAAHLQTVGGRRDEKGRSRSRAGSRPVAGVEGHNAATCRQQVPIPRSAKNYRGGQRCGAPPRGDAHASPRSCTRAHADPCEGVWCPSAACSATLGPGRTVARRPPYRLRRRRGLQVARAASAGRRACGRAPCLRTCQAGGFPHKMQLGQEAGNRRSSTPRQRATRRPTWTSSCWRSRRARSPPLLCALASSGEQCADTRRLALGQMLLRSMQSIGLSLPQQQDERVLNGSRRAAYGGRGADSQRADRAEHEARQARSLLPVHVSVQTNAER